MEFVPIRFEHNEVIDNRKTCTELPGLELHGYPLQSFKATFRKAT